MRQKKKTPKKHDKLERNILLSYQKLKINNSESTLSSNMAIGIDTIQTFLCHQKTNF